MQIHTLDSLMFLEIYNVYFHSPGTMTPKCISTTSVPMWHLLPLVHRHCTLPCWATKKPMTHPRQPQSVLEQIFIRVWKTLPLSKYYEEYSEGFLQGLEISLHAQLADTAVWKRLWEPNKNIVLQLCQLCSVFNMTLSSRDGCSSGISFRMQSA